MVKDKTVKGKKFMTLEDWTNDDHIGAAAGSVEFLQFVEISMRFVVIDYEYPIIYPKDRDYAGKTRSQE